LHNYSSKYHYTREEMNEEVIWWKFCWEQIIPLSIL
jgi:hypothetical protein